MFQKANKKLGENFYTFSIPALKSCPGATKQCSVVCYARHGFFTMNNVKTSLADAWVIAKSPGFADAAIEEIKKRKITRMRIHVAGDLFNEAYAKAWLKIVTESTGTEFWCYTRSFKKKPISVIINQMSILPNVSIWYSLDADTKTPDHKPPGVRYAFLQTEFEQEIPSEADLVFRSKNLLKKVAAELTNSIGKSVKVCPTETGLPGAKDNTCSSCGFCKPVATASTPRRKSLPVL